MARLERIRLTDPEQPERNGAEIADGRRRKPLSPSMKVGWCELDSAQWAQWSHIHHTRSPFAELLGCVAHIHSCGVFVPRQAHSEALYGRLLDVGAFPRSRSQWGYTCAVHRCTKEKLAQLDRIVRDHPQVKFSRLDMTADLFFGSEFGGWLGARFMRWYLFINRGMNETVQRIDFYGDRKRPSEDKSGEFILDKDGKLLCVDENGELLLPDGERCAPNGNFASCNHTRSGPRGNRKQPQPPRAFIVYKDPDDVPIPITANCRRLELRYVRADTIRRFFPMGVGRIMNTDPMEILRRSLCWRFIDQKKAPSAFVGYDPDKDRREVMLGKRSRVFHPAVGILDMLFVQKSASMLHLTVRETFCLPVPVVWAENSTHTRILSPHYNSTTAFP